MAEREPTGFIQKISIEGHEVDLSFLAQASYVESMDLSGPQLILLFNDPRANLRDRLGAKEQAALEVSFLDLAGRQGLDRAESFVILTCPNRGSHLQLNALQKDVEALHKPAPKSQCFNKLALSDILGRLNPGGPALECGQFPVIQDFHLWPGERPSRVLRQAAKEYGAVFFYRRGQFICKKVKEMFAEPSRFTYSHGDIDHGGELADRILEYRALNAQSRLKDRTERVYGGFSMTEGPIRSGAGQGQALEWTGHPDAATLNNLGKLHAKAVEFIAKGNGFLMPGQTLDLVWNNPSQESPLDESLPEKIIIDRAVLHSRQQALHSRVLGAII